MARAARSRCLSPATITDTERLRAAIEAVRTQLGPIGVLVNNAANDERHELADVTPEYWRRAIDLNLTHQFFASQADAAPI